jgi:hypothetical protein
MNGNYDNYLSGVEEIPSSPKSDLPVFDHLATNYLVDPSILSYEVQDQTLSIQAKNSPVNIDWASLLKDAGQSEINSIVIHQGPGTPIEGQTFDGVGISLIDSPDSIIRNNMVVNLGGGSADAINLVNCSGTIIENNIIENIHVTSSASGIYVVGSSNLMIIGNEIRDFTTSDTLGGAHGIYVEKGFNVIIEGNSIERINTHSIYGTDGIRLLGVNDSQVFGNLINDLSCWAATYGIDAGGNGELLVSNNVLDFMNSQSGSPYGIRILGYDFALLYNNSISNMFIPTTGSSIYGIYSNAKETIIDSNLVDNIVGNNLSPETAYGIACTASHFTIINNVITRIIAISTSSQVTAIGIQVKDSPSALNRFAHNVIKNITAESDVAAIAYGIYLTGVTRPIIEFNSITDVITKGSGYPQSHDIILYGNALDTIALEFGMQNNITWTQGSLNAAYDRYYVHLDNILIDSGLWSNGLFLQLNTTNLEQGRFIFTVLILDDAGGFPPFTDTIVVYIESTIIDDTTPIITSIEDFSIEYGRDALVLSWLVLDEHPASYKIYQDDKEIISDAWNIDSPIMYVNETLGVGSYNFTIEAFDIVGNSVLDTVMVTVEDTMFPSVPKIEDFIIEQELDGNNITWHAFDYSPDFFWIYINRTQELNGSWTNEIPIVLALDDLIVGVYNCTIHLKDLYGNYLIDTIWITVVDLIAPQLKGPGNVFFTAGETGNSITWVVLDENPNLYYIFENGIRVINGTWLGQSIEVDIDALPWGYYNITIAVLDYYNNTAVDSVFVTVYPPSTVSSPYQGNETQTSTSTNFFENIDPTLAAGAGAVLLLIGAGTMLMRRR